MQEANADGRWESDTWQLKWILVYNWDKSANQFHGLLKGKIIIDGNGQKLENYGLV